MWTVKHEGSSGEMLRYEDNYWSFGEMMKKNNCMIIHTINNNSNWFCINWGSYWIVKRDYDYLRCNDDLFASLSIRLL